MSTRIENPAPAVMRSLAVIASVGSLAYIAHQVSGCGNESGPTISAESTVHDIKNSDDVPFTKVEGEASATADKSSHVWSIIPFIGGKKIDYTNRGATKTTNGQIEFRAEQNGITYGSYKLPATSSSQADKSGANEWENYGIVAKVDTDKVYVLPSMATLYKNGQPQVDTHQEVLGRTTGDEILELGELATSASLIHYASSCGEKTLPALKAGVINNTRKTISRVASVPKNLPGGEQEAEAMKVMAQKEVKVIFTQGLDHHVIDPTQIKIRYQNFSLEGNPIQYLPNEQAALNQLLKDDKGNVRKDYKDIKITPGAPCALDQRALDDLNRLAGKGITPGV